MFANSPFCERRLAGTKSVRGDVWLRMDPARSGLIERLWTDRPLGYRDYAEWALDAGMFLFKRGDRVIQNSGQTFRSFIADGYQGERATRGDWKLHLSTLFPEARLKKTLELRACDSLSTDLACAVPALFAGLLYDAQALDQVEALSREFSYAQVSAARPSLVERGLEAEIAGRPARGFAERVVDIARGGLVRRGCKSPRGKDESVHLARLSELVSQGRSPADDLTAGLSPESPELVAEMLRRTAL